MLISFLANQRRAVCERKFFQPATISLAALCYVSFFVAPLVAQNGNGNSYAAPPAAVANPASEIERRISRARALAVVGQGVTAARELEAIRVATRHDSAQPASGVAGVMLMGLYIEQADYRRAQTLLNEAHAQRIAATGKTMDDAGLRTYFAIAGQLLNGLRHRLERYKTYNVPVSGADVPVEAGADTEGMRVLLDALIQQARTWRDAGNAESAGAASDGGGDSAVASPDAAALFEDSVGLRVALARNATERQTLNRQLSDARQRLAAVEPRLQPETTRNPSSNANPARNTETPATTNAPASNTYAANNSSTNTAAERTAAINLPSSNTPAASASTSMKTERTSSESLAANGAGMLDVGSLVERATQRLAPSYPQAARVARVSGIVTVYVVVNEKGTVEEVRRAAGPSLLRRAAEDAVRRWKFRPETRDGQPVKVAGHIAFNFAQ
jgi:TonB family protein